MSKILFFSDMHLDNWTAFSTINEFGANTRLISQLNILETILNYAEEFNCKIIFAGDLFNRRLLIPADVLHQAFLMFGKFRTNPIYLLVGNHDMYGATAQHSILDIFRYHSHINVITQKTNVYAQPQIHITLVPYGDPIPAASTKLQDSAYQILVTHYGIHEAKLGPSNYRMHSDLTVKQIKEFGYDLSLFGHIHKAQALADNILVLGSAMAHSFHEVNEEKYFYVFDCEEKKLVKYPTNAPKFLVHEIWAEEDFYELSLDDGNYHRVNILTDVITFQDIKAYTSPNVIISFTKQAQYKSTEAEAPKGRNTRTEVEDYYDNLETDLKKDKLKEMSLSITKEE